MDKKAIQILFDVYWSKPGWKGELDRSAAVKDFAYAKSAGVAFDPIRISHDEVIRRAIEARDAVTSRAVADGFLASLSTRRLDLRSALGSYAYLRLMPNHKTSEKRCAVCGVYDDPEMQQDLSVLSFERFKWGGVRHSNALYAFFDLEQFSNAERPSPTDSDKIIFKSIIDAIKSAPKSTTSGKLEQFIAPVLKSNKNERDILIGILGICGILETSAHLGYFRSFIPESRRELPSRRYVDMAYPACWWCSKDGINQQALQYYFKYVF